MHSYPLNARIILGSDPPAFKQWSIASVLASVADRLPSETPTTVSIRVACNGDGSISRDIACR